jgi:hypothetical protein
MEETTGTCPTCGGPLHTCGGCKACGTCTCEAGGTEMEKPADGEDVGKEASDMGDQVAGE